jgi:hypothetical protein
MKRVIAGCWQVANLWEIFCTSIGLRSFVRLVMKRVIADVGRLQTSGRVLILQFARATANKRFLVRIHIFLSSLSC